VRLRTDSNQPTTAYADAATSLTRHAVTTTSVTGQSDGRPRTKATTRRPERKREPTSQRRVERRRGVGEEGRVSKGEKDDEQVAAVSGVSLVNPTSSQGHLPRVRVDTPQPHPTSTSPSPLSHITPTMPSSRRHPRRNGRPTNDVETATYVSRRVDTTRRRRRMEPGRSRVEE
jgi:hypothetical protein